MVVVSDQEIAKGVETVLRQSNPNAVTTIDGIVKQLETKLGLDLSHKASFITEQINDLLLLRSHPLKDHFALQNLPHYHPQFAFHHHRSHDLNLLSPLPPPPQLQPQPPEVQPQLPPAPVTVTVTGRRHEPNVQTPAATKPPAKTKENAPAGTKRRGGPGGLNKVCGVSTQLQAIVGEPALPRTEIVKQLWAYIRKNKLQDPSNKRKIICDDSLRVVFETDCTDMFKMNKLLAKHIISLEPTKTSGQAKRLKVDAESAAEKAEPGPPSVILSEALAKFFGTGEREMLQSEALGRVWEYIKVNHLEDPRNAMSIYCDAKLQELFGCESISALGISEMSPLI